MDSTNRLSRRRWLVTGALAMVPLVSVATIAPADASAESWPPGLVGPFELEEVLHVRVPMSDGVELEGWVGLPSLPDGVAAPTLLSTSPYWGYCPVNVPGFGPPYGCQATPGDPAWWTEESLFEAVYAHWGIPPLGLVQAGYAVSFFSVRGTANSGGCFDWFGPRTRKDHRELVEWLASQEWSSGRVGAGGLSLPSIGAEHAAIEAPDELKAIVIAGILSDFYTFHFTPQGALRTLWPVGMTAIAVESSLTGFARADDPVGGLTGFLQVSPERYCDDTVDLMTKHLQELAVDERDADFYAQRRLADDIHKIEAAVLLAQGFKDGWVFEDDAWFEALVNAPRRRITGPWPHQFPTADATTFPDTWTHPTWAETVIGWLDHWVKDIDSDPRVDVVDWQDTDGTWRTSQSWPPSSRQEVLYLSEGALTPEPADGDATFLSAPNILNSPIGAETIGSPVAPHSPLCEAAPTGTGLVFVSGAAESPVTIAGSPHLWLRLSSSLAHGLVDVRIGKLTTEFACDGIGQATGWVSPLLHTGAADLRFHAGNLSAQPFPVDTPTQVRVDIPDIAMTLRPGERLALELSYGETHVGHLDDPPYPDITVHGGLDPNASHMVVPIAAGTLGGNSPTIDYPPRPFGPGFLAGVEHTGGVGSGPVGQPPSGDGELPATGTVPASVTVTAMLLMIVAGVHRRQQGT